MGRGVTFIQEVLLAASALLVSSLSLCQTEIPSDEVSREALKFAQVYGLVEQNYVEAVDPDRGILDGGIRGMLSTLDPFSAFFDQQQFEMMQQQARGVALGFGSTLYVQPGKVIVLQTAQGSPSWRAGLGPGDEIVQVNGTRLDRLDFNSLIELLQRSRSHPVRLGVLRPGKVIAQDFELRPAEVTLPTVDKVLTLSEGVGYLHLSAFDQKTPQEVIEGVKQLGDAQLKGLLLDLRNNPGGLLESALAIANLFLKPELPLLTVRGRASPEKSYRTLSTPVHFDMPLVVLVNGNTGSAAEIVAAALQEHDRALIVGQPTFGKGLVQTVYPLSEKTGLALTTAQYSTPSGRSIQRPLHGTALDATDMRRGAGCCAPINPSDAPPFHTDNGRPLHAGGGIAPDVEIAPRTLDPWLTFLNQRGVFTQFASDYLSLHGGVEKSVEPDAEVLDRFRDFLTRQQIRVPEEYWKEDEAYLKLRIKTEILNLTHGLAAGDEVEVRADPQVQKALSLFPAIPVLLKGSAASQRPM